MKKKRKVVNLAEEVEKSFRELEKMPEGLVDENSVLEEELMLKDGLHDEYDWLAQPLRQTISKQFENNRSKN